MDCGLAIDDALARATALREGIRQGAVSPVEYGTSPLSTEVLHALVRLLIESTAVDPARVSEDATTCLTFVQALPRQNDDADTCGELVAGLCYAGWRSARSLASAAAEEKWTAKLLLSGPPVSPEQITQDEIFGQWESELLLRLTTQLRTILERFPAKLRDESRQLYSAVIRQIPENMELNSEREHHLGELSLLIASSYRILAAREDAIRWLKLSDGHHAKGPNAVAHRARVEYQRLAVLIDERRFDQVLAEAPACRSVLRQQGLLKEALKCRFLEAAVAKELGELGDAERLLIDLIAEAHTLGDETLEAIFSTNLMQVYGVLGDSDRAVDTARRCITLMRKLDNRVGLAKIHTGLVSLFGARGDVAGAIEESREAMRAYAALQMDADVAATRLTLAELLLEVGRRPLAELEIRAALPVIEELKLVPEGIAALALLRQSLRGRRIDRDALRRLNGYFDNLQS